MTTFKTGGIADAGPAIVIGLLIGLIAASLMPAQTHTQPASAAGAGASGTYSKCPENTDKGAYFERGVDKDGSVICGFSYYNACPYTEGAENGTPECEKAKPTPEQLQPWQPDQPTITPAPAAQCGGK